LRKFISGLGLLALVAGGCSEERAGESPSAPARSQAGVGLRAAPAAPDRLDRALLLTLAVFPPGPDGKPGNKPGAATLIILRREGGRWAHEILEDPESNVFHKAVPFRPPGGEPGILTIAGNEARLRLWRKRDGRWGSETLWAPTFGGKHNRLRDLELADLDGDGDDEIILATHDQGVVAAATAGPDGAKVRELDRQANTFVHEVEVGDIDSDGVLDILATPSQPNRFTDEPQPGRIMRYDSAGRKEVFADLGDRHAKEVLVADLDGVGPPEVYAAVEGRIEGGRRVANVEIRRFPTEGGEGETLVTIDDLLCRFLVPGDVEGDGTLDVVAATLRSGLWLLRPGSGWTASRIDLDSSSFEHATALLDLDGDGADEIYVAADDQGAVRRYVWMGDGFGREEIFRFPDEHKGLTWNITAVPVELTR
jgi:hypothetical protein